MDQSTQISFDLEMTPGYTGQLNTIRQLYHRYAEKIFGLMLKKSDDFQKAESILKQTFELAYQQIKIDVNQDYTFTRLMETARKICNPDKNHLSGNAVTIEEKVVEMIFCNGAPLKLVAEELQKTTDEIKTILRVSLMQFKHK